FLSIHLRERARLSGWSFRGVPKGAHSDLNDVVKPFLIKGQVASTAMQLNAKRAIEKYYIEKGYLDIRLTIREEAAEGRANAVNLILDIKPGEKIKIDEITFEGNTIVKDAKLRKLLKETKTKSHILKKSKYVETDYENDKLAIIQY